MLRSIDRFLNNLTMYRLTVLGLTLISVVAIAYGFLGVLSYPGHVLIWSAVLVLATCGASNALFAWLFKAQPSIESSWITGWILFLILPPATTIPGAAFLVVAGVTAMASKYLIVWRKQHLLNPAAIGALIAGWIMYDGASWWVGSAALLPVVLLVGLLIVRKLHRFHLFWAGFIASLVSIAATGLLWTGLYSFGEIPIMMMEAIQSWPLLFFCTIMLTEPSTAPPSQSMRVAYGVLVGLLLGTPIHVGFIYMSPELALVIGNVFAFAFAPKQRVMLTLQRSVEIAKDTYQYVFVPDRPFAFTAGQYLEWTLPLAKPDARGNRRYFTIASSPSEETIEIGVKVPAQASTFKQALAALKPGDVMTASQRSGDFVLPNDSKQKLAFIAGGIGVTPFRSMVKWLIDKKESRDIVLYYCCANAADFAYDDLFTEAERAIGLKVVRVVADPKNAPADWKGKTGYLTADMVRETAPNATERLFYISGPNAMVDAYKKLLSGMGIRSTQVKTDYFPGY